MGKINTIKDLFTFLEELETKKIYYKLAKYRPNSIAVEVVVPGERWEIEFLLHGQDQICSVEIEKFKSDGYIYDEKDLEVLFKEFSD